MKKWFTSEVTVIKKDGSSSASSFSTIWSRNFTSWRTDCFAARLKRWIKVEGTNFYDFMIQRYLCHYSYPCLYFLHLDILSVIIKEYVVIRLSMRRGGGWSRGQYLLSQGSVALHKESWRMREEQTTHKDTEIKWIFSSPWRWSSPPIPSKVCSNSTCVPPLFPFSTCDYMKINLKWWWLQMNPSSSSCNIFFVSHGKRANIEMKVEKWGMPTFFFLRFIYISIENAFHCLPFGLPAKRGFRFSRL